MVVIYGRTILIFPLLVSSLTPSVSHSLFLHAFSLNPHALGVFESEDISHVEGDINPIRDLEIIENELRLKDLDYVNKEWDKSEKIVIRGGDKKHQPVFDCLTRVKDLLANEKRSVRFGEWNPCEIEILNDHLFITAKPVVYLINMSEKSFIKKKNKWLPKIKEWVDAHDPGATIIPLSVEMELKLSEMSPDEVAQFTKEHGTGSVLPKIIRVGYQALQLHYFFTCGKDEVRAWTIQVNVFRWFINLYQSSHLIFSDEPSLIKARVRIGPSVTIILGFHLSSCTKKTVIKIHVFCPEKRINMADNIG
ncbi:GTP-binding protein YchF [Fasciola gigantica]|uniref:GTP-binding protein YchF n=1 Tax=Fasciola gigantica TaxID=46835 RepID=A0A504YP94_FASGI|nr:GTP-binding protein YchF [Fasciola gigantica]